MRLAQLQNKTTVAVIVERVGIQKLKILHMVNTNFYISIYWATRNHGGDEEGGWSYWSRSKARDVKRGFKSREQAQNFITKIQPILKKESGQWSWEDKLQAFIFEAQHGPEDYSEQSWYE
jgi:hypothetical protein